MSDQQLIETIGNDHFPDEPKVGFIWPVGKTETPIRVIVEGHRYEIHPNVCYAAAAPIFEVIEHSGYLTNPVVLPVDEPVSPPDADASDDGDGADGEAGGVTPVGTDPVDETGASPISEAETGETAMPSADAA